MLDVAVAYTRYQFLGEEFLTWLWFVIEDNQDLIQTFDPDFVALEIGNRAVFENRRKASAERITIKGEDANLQEGVIAVKKGALLAELNLVYKSAELTWQFTLKGESLNISSLNLPGTGSPESDQNLEGHVLDKLFLYEKVINVIEGLFSHFIKLRVSDHWQGKEVDRIKKWIKAS